MRSRTSPVVRGLSGHDGGYPADASAMRALLPQVAAWPGPVYFRFSRNEVPDVFDGGYAAEIGKAAQIRDGRDVTLIGVGTLLVRCLEAADLLATRGIAARVLDMSTIEPARLRGCALRGAGHEGDHHRRGT